jgi:uncharacterized membrane protein
VLEGWYWDATGSPRFLTNKDEIFPLNRFPGWDIGESRAEAMNESLQVVGTARKFVGNPNLVAGFLYDIGSDTYTQIPLLPGAEYTNPAAINEIGQVVGQIADASDVRVRFVFGWRMAVAPVPTTASTKH